MPRKIIVTPYNPCWADIYSREASLLVTVCGGLLVCVHHIGSTAVPGLAAKPIIDILGEVSDINAVDQLSPALRKLGYAAWGENGLPGRRYFTKGGENRTHHLHIFSSSDPEALRHLYFRDYLCFHPQVAAEYAALKIKLALQHRHDPEGYSLGKSVFIAKIEKLALEWVRQQDYK